MDKLQYIKDKILNRMQNSLSFQQFNEAKIFLNKIPNLDMTNFVGDNLQNSNVGWLTTAKIIESIFADGKELSLENFEQRYLQQPKSQTVRRAEDVIDVNIVEEDVTEKLNRILMEHGEMDFTDSFLAEELTEDGLRIRKFIDSDFTSLDGVDIIDVTEDNTPVVRLELGDTIISPFTGTTNIYQLDNDTFLDIEVEKEFKVRYVNLLE